MKNEGPSNNRKQFLSELEPHSDVQHVDEKWLVSYADMMTLLFGLFVMLFALASEKQGNFKEELKQISKAGFEREPQSETKQKISEADLQKTLVELEQLKSENNNLKNNQSMIDELIKKNAQLTSELQTKTDSLNKPAVLHVQWNPQDNYIIFINNDKSLTKIPCGPSANEYSCDAHVKVWMAK